MNQPMQVFEPAVTDEREAYLASLDPVPSGEYGASAAELDARIDVYLAKLGELETEIARNAEIADRRVQMIRAWEAEANGRLDREAGWLRQAVASLAEGYDYGKKKSRALPHGTFGVRQGRDTLEIRDQAAAVAFAQANGLPVVTSVGKTPLMEHLKATGEVPDGCELRAATSVFFVQPAGAQ